MNVPLLERPDNDVRFSEIVDELTRRGFLGGALGTAGLLALSACGQDDTSPTTESSTRVVDTANGRVTVPAHPSRVVCIDYFTAIFSLELGLTPVGGIDYSWVDTSSMFPAYVPMLKRLADIGQITSTKIEKVAELKPDLILGPTPGSRYDNSKGAMKTLSSLAPVASVDFGQSGDWRSPFEQTAAILNRTEQLKPLVASYQAKLQQVRSAHAATLAKTTVSIVDYAQNGNFAVDLPLSGDGVVLKDLGVRFGKASADNGTNTRELSFERIDALADSDLILFRADAQGKPTSGLDKLVAQPAWKQLPAVRRGHVYPIGWADLCTYRWAEAALADFSGILDEYAA